MPVSSNSLSLAGEFLVLSRLSLMDCVATLTLGHTKGVDILLTNPRTGTLFKLEVKTTQNGITNSRHYGHNIEWRMDKKHEEIKDINLYYCFVQLEQGKPDHPRFFIVPSAEVADYVKWDEEYYYSYPHARPVKHTNMRLFRIGTDSKSKGLPVADFENKWSYFEN